MRPSKYWLAAAAVGVAAVAGGCKPAAGTATAGTEAAAVQAQATAWSQAIAAKDLERTLSFYAEDATYLPAGRPSVSTAAERRRLWIDDFALPGFAADEVTTRIEVARSGELAYQLGTYVLKLPGPDGMPATSTGKFVVVWKKQPDGGWKAIVDIDNGDS